MDDGQPADEPCPDCGEPMLYEEQANPGGGGHFAYECTACDYRYTDGF